MNIQNKAAFEGHLGAIYALCKGFYADEFYSGAADGYLVNWQLNQPEKGTVLFQLESPIYAICKIEDSQELLAVGTANGNLHVLDVKNKQVKWQLKAHQGGIFDLKIIAKLLISAGADGNVMGWNLSDFSKQFQLSYSNQSARTIVSTLTNEGFYVGYSDHSIREFSGVEKPSLKQQLSAHTQSVFALDVHPKTGILVSGGRDAYLRFWQDNQTLENLPAHLSHINCLAFQPSANYLVSVSMDKTIKIWQPHSANLLKVIDQSKMKAHKHSVNKICWLSDTQFITGSDDRCIYLWELNAVQEP